MSIFIFFLVVQAIIAALLVTVILMQKSEGGGLGMGGSPGGLMSARGAADFLTRATTGLAIAFVSLSIFLATLAATRTNAPIDTSLTRSATAIPTNPPAGAPVDGTAGPGQFSRAARTAVQPQPVDNGAVPLQK